MSGALARVNEGASQSRLIAAWIVRQAVMDACFDDQCVKLCEEERAIVVRFDRPMNMEVFHGRRCRSRQKRVQRMFDKMLHGIIRRPEKIESRREIEARKQPSRIGVHHKHRPATAIEHNRIGCLTPDARQRQQPGANLVALAREQSGCVTLILLCYLATDGL